MDILSSDPGNLEDRLREQLRLTEVLFDQTIIGAVTAGNDFRIFKVNMAATSLLNYPSPEVLTGHDINILLADSFTWNFHEQVRSLVDQALQSIDKKCQFQRRDGSPVWVRYKLSFVPGDAGEIAYIVIFFWDYSKEKEMEEKLFDLNQWLETEVAIKTVKLKEKNDELEIALAKLSSLDHTKTEFLRIIGHEIRTPLNGIVGASYLLKEMIRTTEQSEFFEMLQISLRRLEIFAYTALQIAELQTLQNQMPKNPEKLTEVLDELRKLIRFEEYQVTLKVELGNPNLVIMINRPFFMTALTKILENALRFSPSNGEILMIVNREDAGVRFTIRDQGPGFAPGVLLRKFEPFVAGTTHIDKNPALSLSMVKFIVEGHGGVIDMYNAEQGGATVDFTIP